MEYIFVKQKNPDNVVRDPNNGKRLLPDGQLVQKTPYWLERIQCGILEELPINGVEIVKKKKR